jgi:hypothetical protein
VVAGEHWTIGLSTSAAPIEAVVIAGRSAASPTVLLVGGLQQPDQSSDAVAREAAAFERIPQSRRAFRLIAVARAQSGRPAAAVPTVRRGVPRARRIAGAVALGRHACTRPRADRGAGPGIGGRVGAERRDRRGPDPGAACGPVDADPAVADGAIPVLDCSPEIDRRLARSPRTFAEELARIYGQEFATPTYIAAMALISRLRLGERDEVRATAGSLPRWHQGQFCAAVAVLARGPHAVLRVRAPSRDERAKALVLRAAASGFTDNGQLREFMPLHGGWSDSLFMDVPILATAGALTGERRYFDMAARHIAFMQPIVRRPDGLYRHQASARPHGGAATPSRRLAWR